MKKWNLFQREKIRKKELEIATMIKEIKKDKEYLLIIKNKHKIIINYIINYYN